MKRYLALGLALALLLALALVSPVLAKPLTVVLDWRNVVPAGSGNPNTFGDGTIRVNAGQGQLCYELNLYFFYGSWPPTGAAIHRAPAGQNGPLVVDIGAPIPPPNSYTATGCLSAGASLLRDIQRNPSQYYLQVTNETHPNGAMRGQLGN